MIIDSHAHAWERWPYDPAVPDPASRGSAASLLYEMDQAGVDRAVLVAACIGQGDPRTDNRGNNEYALHAAREHPDRFSVLIDVDSRWSAHHHQPGAAQRFRRVLDDLTQTGSRPVLAGITHYLHDDDDGWLGSRAADELVSVVAAEDLLVSLHARPVWFSSLRSLASRFPTTPFLLHHQGHVDADDRGQLHALVGLAEQDNVVVKVSGFHYLTDRPWNFPFPDRRVFHTLLHEFGAHRLVWGSDFPVVRPHLTYRQTLELVRTCSELDEKTVSAICGGTLARLLGL